MKKIIIIAITLMTLMTLVGCGHEEAPKPQLSNTLTETVIEETILEETILEETVIEEQWFGMDGCRYDMSRDEYNDLVNRYMNGEVSKEYYDETLSNSRIG